MNYPDTCNNYYNFSRSSGIYSSLLAILYKSGGIYSSTSLEYVGVVKFITQLLQYFVHGPPNNRWMEYINKNRKRNRKEDEQYKTKNEILFYRKKTVKYFFR